MRVWNAQYVADLRFCKRKMYHFNCILMPSNNLTLSSGKLRCVSLVHVSMNLSLVLLWFCVIISCTPQIFIRSSFVGRSTKAIGTAYSVSFYVDSFMLSPPFWVGNATSVGICWRPSRKAMSNLLSFFSESIFLCLFLCHVVARKD